MKTRKGIPMSTTALHDTIHKPTANRLARPLWSAGAQAVETAGQVSLRYGLVVVLLWIGGMKFTAYEAEGISGFVANSPLMFWAYEWFSQRQFSAILGIAEIFTAVLIAARPFSARLSAVGSALAVGTFLTTLSFLISTPGVIEPSLGFPALSAVPGQFLLKDVVLLGAALWTLGESLRALQTKENH
jgi:uncharacterized membrane protein YkgB